MKVISAEQHPNADALRLYTMQAIEMETVKIIANLDQVYQLDDVVAIAVVGSVLKDGTRIKPSKLRGIYSYGMALEKVEAEIGQDLSHIYCQPEVKPTVTGIKFIKWTSIELLHNVCRNLSETNQTPTITYRAKVKLHGTNAAVQITPSGDVAAQKRSQIITSQYDNAGFATWVSHNYDYFSRLKQKSHLTIFGEWCGNNIQRGVAISKIRQKVLAVFAIQYGAIAQGKLEIRPEKIREILPEHQDIFVLPYYGEPVTLDFGDGDQLQTAANTINQMVEKVETLDPWVKSNFGVEGTGEGLVMYPETTDIVVREGYTELIFKAKGEKHRVVKSKQAAQINPEVAQSIANFVELFVTEVRLKQALEESCDNELDSKNIGQFLKWLSLDIQKESEAELSTSNLTWKEVYKSIANTARKWFMQKLQEQQF
ncbi:MAG: RNA ligase family protein [Cyanobacteria bacterium P01_A01_bin.83]